MIRLPPSAACLIAGLTVAAPMNAAEHAHTDAASCRKAVESGLLTAIVAASSIPKGHRLIERMARYQVPALSMAVIRDGRIEWAAAYGLIGRDLNDPVTTETRFQAASISKPVAAAGMLRLVQDGELALDEDVGLRLQSWKVPDNEFTGQAPVTLRRLLSHDAGMTVHGFPGYAPDQALPTLLEVLDGTDPANSSPVRVDRPPGAGYRYSGGGYQVAQLLVEEHSGESFEAFMRDRVFIPLSMTHSTYLQPLPEDLRGNVARGHGFNGAPVPGGWHVYPEQAAAGLWSTPTDLARFIIGLIEAYRGSSDGLLRPETVRLMLTPQAGNAGLGPGVHGQGEGLHFDHSGWTQGFRTYFVAYPHSGDGAVIMTNGDGGHELISEVLRGIAGEHHWPDFRPQARALLELPAETLDAYAGHYRVRDRDFGFDLRSGPGRLILDTPRGSSYSFLPESESRFVALENGSTMIIAANEQGRLAMQLWGMTAERTREH